MDQQAPAPHPSDASSAPVAPAILRPSGQAHTSPYRTSAAAVLIWAVLRATAANSACGPLVKEIDFNELSSGEPYTFERAYEDFSPYTYIAGYNGDNSGGRSSKAWPEGVVDGGSPALQINLPKGCTASRCAMQAKTLLSQGLESATLKYRFKFGADFDWVRGGKLPGLCGGTCPSNCMDVTGLEGFSSRQMWRPCVWPPEHEDNSIDCDGAKLVAYVYYMEKKHWCGEDMPFENDKWAREYSTAKTASVPASFFQPQPDAWYTLWSHIEMNSAGAPSGAADFKRDGKLQTWLAGPGLPPTLVVDRQDMAWRQFNDITIDTLMFSVFFGGSSPTFQASKDETIVFDDFGVWSGRCTPDDEPFSTTLAEPEPVTFEGMSTNFAESSSLSAELVFETTFTGGGCGALRVTNDGPECVHFSAQVNIDPEFGGIAERDGKLLISNLELLDSDVDAGWYLVTPDSEGKSVVPAGGVNERTKICVRDRAGARRQPDDLARQILVRASCSNGATAAAAVSERPELSLDDASGGDVSDLPQSQEPADEIEEEEDEDDADDENGEDSRVLGDAGDEAEVVTTAPTLEEAVQTVADFVQTFGRPSVAEYPAEQPCDEALGEGGRCVLGNERSACQLGLACMRWRQGAAECHVPGWLGTEEVYEGDVYQVSAGCGGAAAASVEAEVSEYADLEDDLDDLEDTGDDDDEEDEDNAEVDSDDDDDGAGDDDAEEAVEDTADASEAADNGVAVEDGAEAAEDDADAEKDDEEEAGEDNTDELDAELLTIAGDSSEDSGELRRAKRSDASGELRRANRV